MMFSPHLLVLFLFPSRDEGCLSGSWLLMKIDRRDGSVCCMRYILMMSLYFVFLFI